MHPHSKTEKVGNRIIHDSKGLRLLGFQLLAGPPQGSSSANECNRPLNSAAKLCEGLVRFKQPPNIQYLFRNLFLPGANR